MLNDTTTYHISLHTSWRELRGTTKKEYIVFWCTYRKGHICISYYCSMLENTITLFNHVGWFHNPIIILYKALNQSTIIHTFKLTFENLGGVMLPTLFTWNIIHLCHYSHETFFILVLSTTNKFIIALSLNIPKIFTIFLLFILALFIVCTCIKIFLFSKFVPMKVR